MAMRFVAQCTAAQFLILVALAGVTSCRIDILWRENLGVDTVSSLGHVVDTMLSLLPVGLAGAFLIAHLEGTSYVNPVAVITFTDAGHVMQSTRAEYMTAASPCSCTLDNPCIHSIFRIRMSF